MAGEPNTVIGRSSKAIIDRILLHMSMHASIFAPGTLVRVTQQFPQTLDVWSTTVEGTVIQFRQAETGAWYSHAKNDHLWLDRLELERPDGERVVLILDHYSRIEDLSDPSQTPEDRNESELELDDPRRP